MNTQILDISNNQTEGVRKNYPSLIIVAGTPIIKGLQYFSNVERKE